MIMLVVVQALLELGARCGRVCSNGVEELEGGNEYQKKEVLSVKEFKFCIACGCGFLIGMDVGVENSQLHGYLVPALRICNSSGLVTVLQLFYDGATITTAMNLEPRDGFYGVW